MEKILEILRKNWGTANIDNHPNAEKGFAELAQLMNSDLRS
ncbi:MAG: hypothetical protein UR43_C0019G0018 [candidate division TM6 bacterium GW2011_GWF2_33_332]|nr:MAG: hypothetical protein UR43_C0019G0018 [candidate division TM6 bacterium GW2011_GWF2_33_332]